MKGKSKPCVIPVWWQHVSMLNQSVYFIREHVGFLKLSDAYDILDPATEQQIGLAREEISGLMKALRLLVNKQLLPTCIRVYASSGEEVGDLQFAIKRGVSFLRPKVQVLDANGDSLGYFKAKAFSIGATFRVFTHDDEEVALVKGDWKGWNFRFLKGEHEIGTITKKWSGMGKELFTSADNYVISLNGEPNETLNTLLLAAGLAVDCVFKESK